MHADSINKAAVKDRSQAIRLARRAIETLDTKPLEPFVAAMLTDGHKEA